jgi:predicted AAA+ superfamily ATPase
MYIDPDRPGDPMTYIPRTVETRILEAATHFPVVLLTGPRQSGKSTTLKKLFPSHEYVTFDDPVIRAQAERDPALFLADHPAPALFDEIQYVPHILSGIKMEVDHSKKRGSYILTGSQAFSLMEGVTESLAGRVAIFELLPFSYAELPPARHIAEDVAFKDFIRGFFPATVAQKVPPGLFYGSYIQTYLERDLRNLHAVGDLRTFQQLIEILAANVGQVVNLSKIGSVIGVSHSTVRKWISVLEASRLIYLLRPYSRNLRKRFVKSPKLYFTDTGMLAHILRESNPRALRSGAMGGAVFENAVIMDLVKANYAANSPWQFFFYRDNNGVEVDCILASGSRLIPIEIKLSRTPTDQMLSGIRSFQKEVRVEHAYLLCSRPESMEMSKGITAMHWYRFVRDTMSLALS